MRKALLIAALMMTTSVGVAHAGDSWSFMVNGQHVRIERPRNCHQLLNRDRIRGQRLRHIDFQIHSRQRRACPFRDCFHSARHLE